MYSFLKCLPRHESPNLGPSALCNEEANDGVSDCTPGFTDEEYHGGLNSVDLQRGTAINSSGTCFKHVTLIDLECFTWATSSRQICRKKAVALAATSFGTPPMAKQSLLHNDSFCPSSVCGDEGVTEGGVNVVATLTCLYSRVSRQFIL